MKPKLRNRVLTALLSLALLAGLMPGMRMAAFAAENEKSLQIGTGALKEGDFIYYGYDGDSGEFIKWRILSEYGNGGTYEESGDAMFLLSEYGMIGDHNPGGPGYIDFATAQEGKKNAWQGSNAQAWCEEFTQTAFTEEEAGAIHKTTKQDGAATVYNIYWDFSSLAGEQVFFLSAEEAGKYISYFNYGDSSLAAYRIDGYSRVPWYLRSPVEGSDSLVGMVGGTGIVRLTQADGGASPRPAFNLNLDAVLFTSAAEGGKGDADVDGNLTQVGLYPDADTGEDTGENTGEDTGEDTGKEWKLTLLDSSRSDFTATAESTTVGDDSADWVVDIRYSGAQTGSNEYVSAMIVDESGHALYYGRIAQNRADGTAEVTIPAYLGAGSYTLKVFSEQCNGDYQTDYASDFVDIPLTVNDVAGPILTAGTAAREKGTEALVTFSSSEAGSYYYTVVESGATEGTDVNTDGSGTACARGGNTISIDGLTSAKELEVYIVVKDAGGHVSDPLKMAIPACYSVTVQIEGSGTAYAEPAIAVEGEKIQFFSTPGEGYHFVSWERDLTDIFISDNTLSRMPARDVTVKARFVPHNYNRIVATDEYLAAPATCTSTAWYYYSCVCGAKGTEIGKKWGNTYLAPHSYGSWQSNGDGTHTRICQNCNDEETENCTGGTANCTSGAICSDCGAEYGAVDPNNHTGTVAWVQTATTHKREYSCCHAEVLAEEMHDWENGKCTICQYACVHEGGTATCTQKAVCTNCGSEYGALREHALTEHPYKAPCTETGNRPYWECAVCHALFSDAQGNTPTTLEAVTLAQTGHTLTHTQAQAATCTAAGNAEYWRCEACGAYFRDAAGTTEIALSDTAIQATGHSYTDGKCTVCGAIDSGFQPIIIAGAGSTWQRGATDGLSFTSNAGFAGFLKVQVDGKDRAASDYEVRAGSTVVTLKASYLQTLSVGKHTLAIVSDTGTAATEFTILAAAGTDDIPQTGENGGSAPWIVVLLASGAALAAAAIHRRKRRCETR